MSANENCIYMKAGHTYTHTHLFQLNWPKKWMRRRSKKKKKEKKLNNYYVHAMFCAICVDVSRIIKLKCKKTRERREVLNYLCVFQCSFFIFVIFCLKWRRQEKKKINEWRQRTFLHIFNNFLPSHIYMYIAMK